MIAAGFSKRSNKVLKNVLSANMSVQKLLRSLN